MYSALSKYSDPVVNDLIENFEFLEEWEDRYRYVIDLGKKLEGLPDAFKVDENLVQGCTSQVWVVRDEDRSTKESVFFLADSDAFIVKGLIAILLQIYNGKSAAAMAQIPIRDIFADLGLENHLSPIRRNGFYSMVQKLQSLS